MGEMIRLVGMGCLSILGLCISAVIIDTVRL